MRRVAAKQSWMPGVKHPEYLDGTLPGDYGFDPLRLAEDPKLLQRYTEAELQNGRWAMLGVVGMIAVEVLGQGNWIDAAVKSPQTYMGKEIPLSLPVLCFVEFLAFAFVESKRNEETDPVKRCYPGGAFDPLGFSNDPAKFEQYKIKEVKNGRLAMLAFLGFLSQQVGTGTGPVQNLLDHIGDPWHVNVSLNKVALPYL
eukprot:scaffold110_cov315-Pavlova_lutheri.AAC.29